MNNYEDIINLPHHISKNHPRMSMQMRAAQFSPFSALSGYEEYLNIEKKVTEEKKILDEEQKKEINQVLNDLTNSHNKNTYTITYFQKDNLKKGGNYLTITDTIKKIDSLNKYLITSHDDMINIDDIYEIIAI